MTRQAVIANFTTFLFCLSTFSRPDEIRARSLGRTKLASASANAVNDWGLRKPVKLLECFEDLCAFMSPAKCSLCFTHEGRSFFS